MGSPKEMDLQNRVMSSEKDLYWGFRCSMFELIVWSLAHVLGSRVRFGFGHDASTDNKHFPWGMPIKWKLAWKWRLSPTSSKIRTLIMNFLNLKKDYLFIYFQNLSLGFHIHAILSILVAIVEENTWIQCNGRNSYISVAPIWVFLELHCQNLG